MFPGDWGPYYVGFQKDAVRIVIYDRRDGDIEYWHDTLPGVDVGALVE